MANVSLREDTRAHSLLRDCCRTSNFAHKLLIAVRTTKQDKPMAASSCVLGSALSVSDKNLVRRVSGVNFGDTHHDWKLGHHDRDTGRRNKSRYGYVRDDVDNPAQTQEADW